MRGQVGAHQDAPSVAGPAELITVLACNVGGIAQLCGHSVSPPEELPDSALCKSSPQRPGRWFCHVSVYRQVNMSLSPRLASPMSHCGDRRGPCGGGGRMFPGGPVSPLLSRGLPRPQV